MTVTIERDDDLKIIALVGELKATNADSVRDEVISLIDKKPMIISMEKCIYVSSAGLRALLMIAKTAKMRKVEIVYAAATKEVTDVLEMTGFIRMIKCVATVAEAEKLGIRK
ncbi:MAG: STAS domain-containing protein [Selenomonadaceae bacterium]|nr:STAS domain-containing protein [Selenomonadaceae bacterium]